MSTAVHDLCDQIDTIDDDTVFINKWPVTRALLEKHYGALDGRADAFGDLAVEHHFKLRNGPYTYLMSLGLTYGITALPRGTGWWMPQQNAIVVDATLTWRERRSVLTHLLIHAERGDPTCRATWLADPPIAHRCPGSAQIAAAERLIDTVSLACAMNHDYSVAQVAHVFAVHEETVHTRLDHLTPHERQLIALILQNADSSGSGSLGVA